MFHRNAAKKMMHTQRNLVFVILLIFGFSSKVFSQKPGNLDWFVGGKSLISELGTVTPILDYSHNFSGTGTYDNGEKPQSKVWFHAGKWWCVFPTNSGVAQSGTWIFRLDVDEWTPVLLISNETNVQADCKSIGSVTHIVLHSYDNEEGYLVSVEHKPSSNSYQIWNKRPGGTVTISLPSSETATLEIDSANKMWIASENGSNIIVKHSDYPYTSFSSQIIIAGTNSDDISAIIAMPDATIGILWSDQNDEVFYYKYHVDGANESTWSAAETITNGGTGFGDDHVNLAVSSDGKLYAGVKTTDGSDMYILVRNGTNSWTTHFIDGSGTRPMIILSDYHRTISLVYQDKNGGTNIVYSEASMDNLVFSSRTTLIAGSNWNVSSTKQAYTNELVFIASNASTVVGIFLKGNSPQQQFEKTFTSGWNIVGMPSDVVDSNYLGLFPNAENNTLYSYDSGSGYSNELHITEGNGYWVKFSSSGSAVFTGDALNTNDLDLASGWNLISGISCSVALDDVTDNSSIIEPGTLFGFSGGGYVASDVIEQGKGYWIYANSAGTITLDCNPPVGTLAKSRSAAQIRSDVRLDERPQLVFSNATGTTQTLYFATEISPDAMASFQLPPVAPFPSFDVRYPNDTRLTDEDSPLLEVRLIDRTAMSARNLPLKSGESYVLDLMAGRQVVESIPLSEGETITLDQPYLTAIQLRKSLEINDVITSFAVEQNFPNPFNPQTEIRFQIPQHEYVEIRIFNTLGQEVRNLLAENREAGSHKIIWNGLDNGGREVSSGTYFYSVVAGEHHIVKRMVLLR